MGMFDFAKSAAGGRGGNTPAPSPAYTPDLESNYDLDYGYVALYDRDMKNHGEVLPETVRKINKQIRQTNVNMSFRDMGFDASAMMADYTDWQHDFVMQQENINPNDGIPAYVESMMYKGPTGTSVQYKAQGQDMKNEFYNTVYYCKDVLNDVTLRTLGSDYTDYAKSRMQAESAQSVKPQPGGSVRRSYEPDPFFSVPSGSDDQYGF